MHQSTLEECVVKVVKENGEVFAKDNLHFERTRSNTPRYLRSQELRRFKHASGNRMENCRRGTLTQFHQRVAIGRTRIYKDKQFMQRIEDFKYDAQLDQKHNFIAEEFIRKINKKQVRIYKSYREETISRWSSGSSYGWYWSCKIGTGPCKGIIENQKIMKVCLSKTHASGNREASTHNDWWKSNWWNGMMNSENFERVPNPYDELNMFLSRWSRSDECRYFLDRVFLSACSSNNSVYDGRCTYTHLSHAHFLRTARSLRGSHIFMRVTYTHGSCVCKKVFAHVSFLSISPSPFSCLTHLCCSRTVTSRPLPTLTSLTIPSTRSFRTYLS